jgi:CHAD domain-containing protein
MSKLLTTRIETLQKELKEYMESAAVITNRAHALEDLHSLRSAATQLRQAHETINQLMGIVTARELGGK